jgi:uncharacterized repeat protein (TIGR01451 family)
MMYQKYLRFALAAAAALLLSTTITRAQTIAYDAPVQPGNQGYTFNLGLDFNVTAGHSIVVSKLGAFDNNGDGFTGTVSVAIFNRSTTAQVGPTATFTGTTGTLVNGDRFIAVTPFVLPPGSYSVVAVGFNSTDLNGNSTIQGFIASTENTGGGLISFVGTGRFDANPTLDFPTTVVAGLPSNVFLAGTFQFVAAVPPVLTKAFNPASINVGDTTLLAFTITNPNATVPLSGVGFTDNLPAGVVVATPNGLTGSCGGGSITAPAGSGTVSLTGATLAAGASCTFSANVVGTTPGIKPNTTTAVTSNLGTGNTASATLTVVALPPTLTKAFADPEIQLFGPSTALSFTLTNPNTVPLTGLAFTDTLPAGLIVSTPNGVTGSCGGTVTAIAGSNGIGLSGGTLAAGASCTFAVNVTGTTIGVQTNTTSTVTSNEASPGAPATASTAVDFLYFYWFFAA